MYSQVISKVLVKNKVIDSPSEEELLPEKNMGEEAIKIREKAAMCTRTRTSGRASHSSADGK